jgi:hypothetical protein
MVDSIDSVILAVSMGFNREEVKSEKDASSTKTPRKQGNQKGYIERNPRVFYLDLYSFHEARKCVNISQKFLSF